MFDREQLMKKLKNLWSDSRSYGSRLLIAGAVALACGFTFLFFGPLELVAFSGGSLVYGWQDVIWLLLGVFVGFVLIAAPLLALLRGRIFNYTVTVAAAVVVAGYLQALLLNGGLGLLTGDGIDWAAMQSDALWGLAFWTLVLIVLLFVMYLNRKLWALVLKGLCLVLVFMQLVPTVAILCGVYNRTQPNRMDSYFLSDEGFYEFSAQDNVFVFVLDRLDYDYIERVLQEDPDFFKGLNGFTSYTNAISGFARTKPALIHMLTGADQTAYRMSKEEYFAEAWSYGDKNLLEDLDSQGYQIEMYSSIRNLFSQPELPKKYVDNLSDGRAGMHYGTVLGKLLQLSAFRYAPTALKPFFWADTNYYNQDAYKTATAKAYEFNDAAYALGFSQATAQQQEGSFKLYHFYGPHAPYTMKADGTASEEPTTVTEQTMGSFVNLMKLFDRMKELGIYEDATIIITGDHGAAVSDTKPLQKATRVGLFYKPAGQTGALKTSSAPVTTEQVAATVAKAAGADHTAYGKALDEVAENDNVVRVYYKTVCDTETFRETQLCIYHVTGDAADFANWELVQTVDISYSYN